MLEGGRHEGTFELWVDPLLHLLPVAHQVSQVSNKPPVTHVGAGGGGGGEEGGREEQQLAELILQNLFLSTC